MAVWPNGTKTKPYVSSGFGPRNLANPNASKFHRGMDTVGFSTVRAVEDGVVRVVGTPGGWSGGGTQVWIQHDGFFSRSLHLASYSVYVGQEVKAGDPIGVMGRTGAIDIHLHLEISPGTVHHSNTGQVDPVPFITERLGSLAGNVTAPTPAPVPEEDDDMIAARITDGQGRKHHAIIGNGYLRHLIAADNPEWMKNVTTADDKWTEIVIDQLPSVLRSYSCDLHIWDIRNGSFVVLDPITGNVAPGMLWSAVNALRSTVASVKVTSEQTKAYVEKLATKS